MKLKIGNKVKIVKSKFGHGFSKDEEVEILGINRDESLDCRSLKTGQRFWCQEEELKCLN